MEEEAMPIPVQETPLTTCSPPSTAASIANLEYPEEPLPTAASVASEECPEPLPMAVTVFSYGCPDLPKTDDPNTLPGQTSVVCLWTYVCTCHMHRLYWRYYMYSTYVYHVICICVNICVYSV